MKIVFYGTPEFAVPSLEILLKNNYNVTAVITAPDKPSGRGLKMNSSAVKLFAEKNNIEILQPVKLKDDSFLNRLKEISPDLQIVVAFRKMPESVWGLPKLGTFNLHASLLPQYRGAAPINHAIINGEKETGVTTFFLEQEVDTGKIIFSEKVSIGEHETAGELHDKLMVVGANLVLKTVNSIEKKSYELISQQDLKLEDLNPAPKITKEFCRVNWNKKLSSAHNHIRGLSPYPGAFTTFVSPDDKNFLLKIHKAIPSIENEIEAVVGTIHTDSSTFVKVKCSNGWLVLQEIQMEGKKRMNIHDFLRGHKLTNEWKVT